MKSRTKKFLVKSIILFCIILALVLFWAFRYELATQGIGVTLKDSVNSLLKKPLYPVNMLNEPLTIKSIGQRVIVINDKEYSLYDPLGNEILSDKFSSNSPVIKSNGNYYIIYSHGGNNIKKYSGSKLVFDKKINGNIVSASITNRGCISLTYYNGLKYSLIVFDTDNDTLLTYNTENTIFTGSSLSDDGKMVAINCIYLDNGQLCSKVRVLKVYDGTELSNQIYPDELILDSVLQNDNSITIVTDKAVYINDKTDIFTDKLDAFKIFENGDCVVITDKMRYYNHSGTLNATAEKNSNINNIYECENGFIVYCKNYAHHYDNKLKLIASMYTPGATELAITKKYIYYVDSATLSRVPLR